MYEIFILLAGVVLGIWHRKTVRAAEHRAYRAGQAQARQRARVYRVQNCREAIPVPGYAEAKWVDHGVEHHKIVSINAIAQKAIAEGRAVGRVQ